MDNLSTKERRLVGTNCWRKLEIFSSEPPDSCRTEGLISGHRIRTKKDRAERDGLGLSSSQTEKIVTAVAFPLSQHL